MFRSVLFLALSLLLLNSCIKSIPQSVINTSPYNEDSAMAHYLTDPDRAIRLLDSAVVVRTLTPQRCEYLKAMIEYSAKEDFEAAMSRCQLQIDKESWKSLPDSEDVVSFQVDLYRLMATICTTTGKYLPAARYAREGAALSHGIDKLRGDEVDFLSRMGLIMSRTGQYDEALEALRRAESLAASDNTWSSLVSYFNNSKRLYETLNKTEKYQEAKREVMTSLDRLEHLRTDIQKVKYAPEGMVQDSSALEEFIEFFQTSYFCYLVNIYVHEQQTDSALFWLQRVYDNPQAQSSANLRSSLIQPLYQLGKFDEAEALINDVRLCYGADTANHAYLELMNQARQLAANRGNYSRSSQLADSVINLSNQLNTAQLQMMLADAATEYHLLDERQRRQDAENRLMWIIVIILSICALGLALFAFSYIHKLLTKQRMLNLEIALTKKKLDEMSNGTIPSGARSTDMTPESIYLRALELVVQQELYKNTSLDIVLLSKLLNTNRNYLSRAINTQAGMNFRTWLAQHRIEKAKQMLLRNPSITGEELAVACGFENRMGLYRQFKTQAGMSITDWLRSHR